MRDEKGMIDRRTFVGSVTAALAAAGISPSLISLLSSLPHLSSRISSIGLQLYTVRNLMKTDFEGTLTKVAEIGYREVEFAGYYNRTPAEVRGILDRHGLVSPAGHMPFESLGPGWNAVLDASRTIGHQYAVIAWIPAERRKTADDWRRIAALFNEAGEACKRAGVRFAYHNHNMEFAPVEGRLPFDLLLDGTDRALVDFEMDLFWITFGGGDPLAYFAKYPGRPGASRRNILSLARCNSVRAIARDVFTTNSGPAIVATRCEYDRRASFFFFAHSNCERQRWPHPR